MGTEGILRAEDYLKEVIKLQLKKPKRWNWELTTSKSSPHLALPIIQLFDSKGNLLVEAKDTGITTERRSWHSANPQQRPLANIQRCRSDTSHSVSVAKNRHMPKIDEKTDDALGEEKTPNSMIERRRYKRARSDDLFKRLLKHNEDVEELDEDEAHRRRYETRTSSAGTLIIQRYSFAPTTRRRRPKRANSESYNNKRDVEFKDDRDARTRRDRSLATAAVEDRYGVRTQPTSDHLDAASVVAAAAATPQRLAHSRSEAHLLPEDGRHEAHSLSGPATRRIRKQHHHRRQQRIDLLCRSGGAGDASTSTSSSEREEEDDEGLDARHEMLPAFDHSFRSYKRRQSKAKALKEQAGRKELKKAIIVSERPSRLSPIEDVRKMGANVSRHSSKGLSGRRTQSSGSICKSKKGGSQQQQPHQHFEHYDDEDEEQQQEQPVCGSLPSYLEASNNNHDYEKLPLNDVERIPPLGDGAPLHWKFSDNQTVLCDQGYGSERSPEEEFPPPLPEHDNQCNHHLDIHSCYPFITPETTFSVSLAKGSRGLGLSVTGGIDSGGSWPGLIRVKRLFPHQPAAACGVLNVGDLILEANGIPLTGLTNYEALEVLRTSPSQVELRICRPPPDVLNCVSPISEVPPPPPRREPAANQPPTPEQLNTSDDEYSGEFEIAMRKIGGSLGFTLRKEDDSALGHYIRALVRDPALNDGRIRPGDKIIAVNNVEISSMSHDEAVRFLRKCGQLVKLRLYRDAAQTPIATLSPTETTPRTSFTKKTQLRKEAVEMLNDIAVRKLLPNTEQFEAHSPQSSPRRLRSRVNCPSDASEHLQTQPDEVHYYVPEEQFHEGLLQRGGYLPFDEESFNSLFIHDDDDCDKPSRPLSLEIYNPNQTPVACRKPKFNFSLAHNAYELNNLDAEILDAPNLTYNLSDEPNGAEVELDDNKYPTEPTSMPHIPLADNAGFSYKNPAYQSAHPQCGGSIQGANKENGGTLEHKKPQGNSNTLPREPEKKPRRKKSIIKEPKSVPDQPEVIAIELNRRWNSRMGFSLQGPTGRTYVSAVYPNTVASKDGRIKVGDRLVKVNEESVELLSTNEIIDLLRILRGPISIVLVRDPGRTPLGSIPGAQDSNVYKDCTSKAKASNAVN